MKKIFIIIISLITIFTFSVGFTREPYSVSASTVADYELDYNLVDIKKGDLETSFNAEVYFVETGFFVRTGTNAYGPAYVDYSYTLVPNVEYRLTYTAEKATENSDNLVRVYNNDEQQIASVTNGASLTFVTDSTGKGKIRFYAALVDNSQFKQTKYTNVRLQFANERLISILESIYGQIYKQGYNDGLSDYESWVPYTDPSGFDSFQADIDTSFATSFPYIDGGINPFGFTMLSLAPGTYRISFTDKASGFYPMFYDFGGVTHYNYTLDVVTPIYFWDLDLDLPDRQLNAFNESGSLYSFDDALACEPIIFYVPTDVYGGSWGDVGVYLFMMRLDDSLNFVHWDKDTQPRKDDLYTLEVLEPKGGYFQGYDDGYNQGISESYDSGYIDGHYDGYQKGYNAGLTGTVNTNWFVAFLNSVLDILNIEVFPNIKLIYILFIPIGLGILALIFKLVRG